MYITYEMVQTVSKARDASVTANAHAAGATGPAASGGWTRLPPSVGDPRYDPSGSITSSW